MDRSTQADTIVIPASTPGPITLHSTSHAGDEGRFLPGTLLAGRYRLIGLLGRGGMGEVYRATDLMLGQPVALKFLPETAAANPMLLERFHGEVRVARQVSHPNVCRVYDIGATEGMPFISMEYVDGEDLATLLTRIGRLPAAKALETARQICAGLAAAHARGVIHRDLKPQNIMMNRRGEVMLMDFGLAALSEQVSGAEARHGTPAYMSPEQLRGGDVTARSDIFALGLVLYELFTGKRAYEADNLQDMLDRQEARQLTSITALASDTDPSVERVIRRCLDPEPLRRPATALQVSAALPGGDPLAAALAAGETPSPELVASAGKTEGLRRRYAVACLAIVLVSVFTLPFIKQNDSAFYSAGLDLPPDVLRHKIRETAAEFGYPDKPADRTLTLTQRRELLQYLGGLTQSGQREKWLRSEAPIGARYRESASILVAEPFGGVTRENPAPIEPGMLEMEVEGHGLLRSLAAMPRTVVNLDPARVADATAVFRAAGLELAQFQETSPLSVPRTPADDLRAWKGPHPAIQNTELTVEAGWWRGRLTHFRVFSPWEPAPGTAAGPARSRVRDLAGILMLCSGLAFVLLLARRNWKLNRGDRRGALRLGAAVALLELIVWAGTAHLLPSAVTIFLFLGAARAALFSGVVLWLMYLALEPAVRARWPHSIVTWSRLLTGRWNDPQAAGHILIGAAAGSALLLATILPDSWTVTGAGFNTTGGLGALNGASDWFGGLAAKLRDGIVTGLVVFFLVFCLRAVLRRDWAAGLASAAALAYLEGDVANSTNPWVTYGIFVIIFAALAFVLLRVGLLSTVSAVFFLNVVNAISLGTDWTIWSAPTGVATLLFVLAIVGTAFYFSLGSRELLGGGDTEVL